MRGKNQYFAMLLLFLLVLTVFPVQVTNVQASASSVWERSRTSSDGHFIIYYNTTDPSTPISDNDVTDEYVQWVEDALIYSWSVLIDHYEFKHPPRTMLPQPLKYIIPVYIKQIPWGGVFYPDFAEIIEYLKEFFFRDPKYSENIWYHIIINTNLGTRANVNVTVAHEFFHAIQRSYQLPFKAWISEGTAVWAEDIVYDDVNNYVGYVNSGWWQDHDTFIEGILRNPNKAFTSLSYDAVLYWKFLGERYGGKENSKQVALIKKVFELGGGIQAIDSVLKDINENYSFEKSFLEWTIWNYLKHNYEEGHKYREIDLRDISIPRIFSQQEPIEKYASEYINLKPPVPMTLAFDGDWLTDFVVRILKIRGTIEEIDTVSLNWLKDGSLLVSEAYDKIILIITRLDDLLGDGTYTIRVSTPYDFYITVTPEQILYKLEETTKTTVTVTNTRGVRTEFWLGVSFKDHYGEYSKYNSQISITPASATLDPGQSTTFLVTWIIPSDAPIGYYQIAVNCWKDSEFKQSYTDNLDWSFIFYVYKLNILTPTESAPAIAGDPNNPNQLLVSVEWIPRTFLLFMSPTFSIKIDNQPATYELTDIWSQLFGIYTLKINPPTVPGEGLYDLNVEVTFGHLTDSDTEQKAIRYVTVPPAEPIQKGLAWLRNRQRADGSWYGYWGGYTYVGVTSLVALAFLNAGFDETDPTVRKAIQFILRNVRSDGSIYSNYDSRTYETSLAIIALVATRNESYRSVIENAKNWLVNSQWDESCLWGSVNKDDWYYGGFGYGRNIRPDLSNTQFALLALDAAGLPKDDPLWKKVQVFLHRCQNVNFSITLNIDGEEYTVQPYNHLGGYDGGFIYHPGASLAGGQRSYGSMTGAGIWGLLLSGVRIDDRRVQAALNWVKNHYTWNGNPGMPDPTSGLYYYYLSMSKALTMTRLTAIDGHDWYKELYDKLAALQRPEGYWVNTNSWAMEGIAEYTTACAILSLQTRVTAPPIHRLSYLTFILRSNCLLRVIDPVDRPVGYNYVTGLGENQVPTAVYSGPFMEPQYIVIVNPKAGTYRLELIGISEGPYELTIQGNYGEEVTDVFEYKGEIKPAELHGCDVTVTAIVGPIDIYANPPEFEKTIDNIPPTTTLYIGEPKYISPRGDVYVSSATQFTLTAEDDPGGTGVASTFYRIYNNTYDTGWLEYSAPFYLVGLADGEYSIDYYSIDNIGNNELINTVTVVLDNTPSVTTLIMGEPKYTSDKVYVTPETPFTLEAVDAGSGVFSTAYRIFNANYDSGWQTYNGPFNLAGLIDGVYTIEYHSIDNLGNEESTKSIQVTLFSWDYVFEDSYGRGTVLKINLAHKFIQFITPDKDYGIRKATYMRQCGRAIIIHHCDNELRLNTVAVDTRLDFCIAIAWDKQTNKQYFLIDKAGKE